MRRRQSCAVMKFSKTRISATLALPSAVSNLIRHGHGAQRQPFAGGKLLRRALELPAGREDVTAARRAHRRGIAGVEHHLRKLLDLLPVRALVSGAGPG